MTSFSLICAFLFPMLHLGRMWTVYYMIPLPNQRQLWANFQSPLTWDMLAITTYLLGSTIYVYLPMIPDLAMVRDHTKGWRHTLYKLLSLGWRGLEYSGTISTRRSPSSPSPSSRSCSQCTPSSRGISR